MGGTFFDYNSSIPPNDDTDFFSTVSFDLEYKCSSQCKDYLFHRAMVSNAYRASSSLPALTRNLGDSGSQIIRIMLIMFQK